MSDRERRARTRAWQANPSEQAARAAEAALRRVGEPVPRALRQALLHPARRYDAPALARVWAELPEGTVQPLGWTPAADPAGVEIPPHRRWGVTLDAPHPCSPAERAQALVQAGARALHVDLTRWTPRPGELEEALREAAPPELALDNARGQGAWPVRASLLDPVTPDLSRLRLAGCQLTRDALARLASFARLTHLDLAGSRLAKGPRELDRAALVALVALVPRLLGLGLERSAVGLDHLLALGAGPGLEELSVGHGVDFRARPASDADLAALPRFRALSALHLVSWYRSTDAGMAHVGQVPTLEELTLEGAFAITDAGLEPLCELPRLRALRVWGASSLTDRAFALLARRPTLELLELLEWDYVTNHGLTGAALAQLASLERLRQLRLEGAGSFAGEGLPALPALRELDLLEVEVSDRALTELAAQPALETLRIAARRRATPAGLAALARAPRLTRLELALDDLGDEALEVLGELPVKALELRVRALSDPQCAALARRPLRALTVVHAPELTDAGLAALAASASLQEVRLGMVPAVTSRGLRALLTCPTLRHLRRAGLKEPERAALQRAFQRCLIA